MLLCGYFAKVGVYWVRPIPGSPIAGRSWAVELDTGTARVIWMSTAGMGSKHGAFLRPGLPRVGASLWGFEAFGFMGTAQNVLQCPIWLLAIPFTIAPIVWLRRRKRDRVARGFVVEAVGGRSACS